MTTPCVVVLYLSVKMKQREFLIASLPTSPNQMTVQHAYQNVHFTGVLDHQLVFLVTMMLRCIHEHLKFHNFHAWTKTISFFVDPISMRFFTSFWLLTQLFMLKAWTLGLKSFYETADGMTNDRFIDKVFIPANCIIEFLKMEILFSSRTSTR